VAGETLSFDIFARLREDGFAKAGKAASAATDDVLGLARRLDELSKKSATARVALAGDKEALAALDKFDLKLLTTGRRVVDPKISLDGAAKAQAEIAGLEVSLDKLGAKSADATAAVGSSSGGLAGPAGMGALIGAGVALSPVLATVAVGVGGFGLAAAGAVAPIAKAAQATGGLRANMSKLDPEQRKLAGSVLGLEKQYHAFSKSLEPQTVSVFSKGIALAGDVMHDVQPVAAATGKALGTMLGAIDDEFQGGTWQNFFGFMERTAGPDIKLLTNNFTDLMEILPPLLQDLQPVATGFLQLTDDVLKLTGAVIKASDAERHIATEAHNSSGFLGELAHATERAVGQMLPGIPAGTKLAHALSQQADSASKAGPGIRDVTSALKSGISSWTGTTSAVGKTAMSVDQLTASMAKNVSEVLTLQGDEIGWRQSLQAASKQLDSNSAGLRGNSKDALANKAAVLQATQNVVTFAGDQLKLGGDLHAASGRIQDQIAWLQKHGDKSAFARREIHALRMEEDKLRATIRQKLLVSASGFWKVTGALQGGVPQAGGGPVQAARGMFINQGRPGVDDQLIWAQRNELVVPVPIVKAGLVDHLRGLIPGFDSGGVVGNYSGSVGGAPKWLAREDAATLRAVEVATAAATAAGVRSAQAAASGGFGGISGGGGGGPNVAIGQRMAASIGWTGNNWAYLRSGWMEESGWRTNAQNPAGNPWTAAYGIPQSNPGVKMAAAGADWLTNPATQIRWGLGYIRSTYGSPTHVPLWSAAGPLPGYQGYAEGGVVGDSKPRRHVSAQQQRWLNQLARDVKVLEADQKHAAKRRALLNRGLAIDELWFLTHPHVKKGGIGWNEQEKALSRDRRILRHFNKTENEKETILSRKIALLRLLTHYPRGKMYGGPGVPAPAGDGTGDGTGDGGGGDTGGGTTPGTGGPPPIPPPPMPAWMAAAGLGPGGSSPGASFPAPVMAPQSSGGGMSWPEPVAYQSPYGGGRSMGWGGGGDLAALISAIREMHQGVVGAVGRVAPGTTRGLDESLNRRVPGIAAMFQ
jgi:hypothetical protein